VDDGCGVHPSAEGGKKGVVEACGTEIPTLGDGRMLVIRAVKE
jgi:hypothetical protein